MAIKWNKVQPFSVECVPLKPVSHNLLDKQGLKLQIPTLCFIYHNFFLFTDTANKLQEVKDKARQANDTAKNVLVQIRDLHQNLDGLKKNYNQLADSVAKTNAVVKDPLKNSKISFFTLILFQDHK